MVALVHSHWDVTRVCMQHHSRGISVGATRCPVRERRREREEKEGQGGYDIGLVRVGLGFRHDSNFVWSIMK
jgi:hypothetical protein